MTTFRYRDHRGSLTDSLETTIIIGTLDELRDHLNKTSLDPIVKMDRIAFVPLPLGVRAATKNSDRWETHTVTLNGCAIGYADGVIPDITINAADKFNTQSYQVEINGKSINVADLDIDQLRQELCQAIETIELLDEQTGGANYIISEYRKGGIKPPISDLDHLMSLVEAPIEFMRVKFGLARGRFTIAYDKLVAVKDQLEAVKKEAK